MFPLWSNGVVIGGKIPCSFILEPKFHDNRLGDGDINMFSLEIDCDPEDRDLLIAELWEQGSTGIVELALNRVRAFFEDEVDRAALLKLYPGSRLRIEED